MSDYSVTQSRIYQWVGILLLLAVFAGAYWYFSARAGVKSNTASSQPQGVGNLDSGLAGYWKLDETTGSGGTDSSTNGNNGTLTNMENGDWGTGQIGNGLTFDGVNEYVSVSDTDALDFGTNSFSVSLWLKTASTTSDRMINKITSAPLGWLFDINTTTGGAYSAGDLRFRIRDSSGNNVDYAVALSLNDNNWHLVTAIVDRSGDSALKIFADGVQVGSTSLSSVTASISNAEPLALGTIPSILGNYFDGQFDEVRVYSRTLSSDEVAQIYRLTSPTSVDTSFKGYWSFDGQDMTATTTYDRSGAGNNGTLTNGPTITEGVVGQALSFDGTDDDVRMSDATSLDITGTVTLSAWIKKTSHPSSGEFDGILAKGTSASSQVNYAFKTYGSGSSEQVAFYFINSGEHAIRGSTNLDLNQWYLVTAVYDDTANSIKLYVNGVLQTNTVVLGSPETTSILANNQSVYIGSQAGVSQYFPGNMDEMRIYNRALSVTEIQSLYGIAKPDKTNSSSSQAQGTGRLDSGLAGYWALDDGSGTSATDSSTNGNTGTLTNGPTWGAGQIGNAVNFDNTNDYIDLGDVPAMEGQAALTISAWINPTALGNYDGIVSKFVSATSDTTLNLGGTGIGTTSSLVASIRNGSDAYGYTATGKITTGTWIHSTMVFDGSQTGNSSRLKIYINGVSEALTFVGTIPTTTVANAQNLIVGRTGGAADYFSGSIDEVRVYNRALSADEVGQLYRLTTPTSVDTSLKGYWSFNGNDMSGATAYDRSGAGNTGTLTNSPSSVRGIVGQALSFDGTNDYVNVPDSVALSPTTALSYSFWAKRTDTVASNTGFLAKSDGAGGRRSTAVVSVSGGAVRFCVAANSNDNTSCWDTVTTGLVQQNQWVHVTAVFDGLGATDADRAKVYVNGVEQALSFGVAVPSSIPDVVTPLTIGGNAHYPYFPGILDEIRVYNRALTAAEIQSQYDAVKPDKINSSVTQPQGTGRLDSGLAGYWKMDDGSGTSASDVSTNSNTGTLTGGPTWTTGQIGGAVSLDGVDDYVDFGTSAINDANPPFTQSIWVYPTAVPAVQGVIWFQGGDYNGTETYVNALNVYDNLVLKVGVNGSGSSSQTGYLPINTWYHIVMTLDSSARNFYLNGKLYASDGGSAVTERANNMRFGCDIEGTSCFPGKIDEARSYNHVLSADEVSQLYHLGTPTSTDTSLKGYWSFNGKDVSGTTAYDRSGAGNNGTLTNSPTVVRGKLGQALSFDGTNDYVVTANAVGTLNAYTVCSWMKPNFDDTDTTARSIIIRQQTAGDTDRSARLIWDGVSNRWASDSRSAFSYTVSDSLTPFKSGEWHHICFGYNNAHGTGQFYWDGVARTTVQIVSSSPTPSNTANFPFYIGSEPGSAYFNGSLDEVRVYNRALSASEILGLYNQSR